MKYLPLIILKLVLISGLSFLIHLMTGFSLINCLGITMLAFVGLLMYFIFLTISLMIIAGLRSLPYGK